MAPVAVGSLLDGRYRLVRELAAGGAGTVYEAESANDGARVAVKVLRPEMVTDEEIRRRFRRESSILEALRDPAIVRVLDSGEDEGSPYIVMELLDGETLRATLARGTRFEAHRLVPMVEAITGGLEAAHAQGVIHGDLKPENVFLAKVLVGRQNTGLIHFKLFDFGMAKIFGLDRLTRTGEIAGTPLYMAPELVMGARELDGRSDTYAVGVILYECLAGRAPFSERHPARLLGQIVAGQVTPLASSRADLPEGVAAVVERAMAVRAEDRFASPSDLAEAYRRALA